MKVIKVSPQGYCYGVVRAINIAKKVAQESTDNVYILGDIVHNEFVSLSLSKKGITIIEDKTKTRLELLDQIESGTVIFTAHGVSDAVRIKAALKGLTIIDATCPEVFETQEIIKEQIKEGYRVIFIGKKSHPEAEACIRLDESIIFIDSEETAQNTTFENNKYFITYQSTLNIHDVKHIVDILKTKLEDFEYIDRNSICQATTSRQEAVATITDADFVYIVGDNNSNNSAKLVERAISDVKVPAKLILNVSDINIDDLKDVKTIAVSSGASTPPELTNHIISYLKQLDLNNPLTYSYPDFTVDDMLILKK